MLQLTPQQRAARASAPRPGRLRRGALRLSGLLLAAAALTACDDAADPARPSPSAERLSPVVAPCPELDRGGARPVSALWDGARTRPLRLQGELFTSSLDPEGAARAFLRDHAALLKVDARDAHLQLAATRNGLAGTYLRFQQMGATPKGAAPLPVFEGQIVVLVAAEAGRSVVRAANLAHRTPLSVADPAKDVGVAGALAASRAALGNPTEDGAPEIVRGIGGEPARVAYRVRMSTVAPDAAWEVLVDAATGHVLSKRDRIARVSGSGFVFDPNPVASTGDSTLADNNNATSPALDAARFNVILPNLDGSGFTRGTWVDAHTKNINARTQSASLIFEFTRADSGFEQVNAYFHLDRTQTRLQSLGIANANASSQGVITDGQQGDNSYFDPAKDVINYGQGGVDDAEDADVVIHEYGHAIQDDQVPNFGAGGDAGAMGEGFGDYLATSMNRLLSKQIDDPDCFAEWDATFYAMGNPPCLRRTDGTKHFPEFAVGEVHDDGEMWASALSSLDVTLGPDVMNRVVVESQFSMSTTESFFNAVQAMIDTDTMVFGGAHQSAIRRRMIQQGLCRTLSTPSPLSNVLSSVDVSIGNPLVAGKYANHLDDTQTFTQPGALALRLHFTSIATEDDPTCLDGGCDNVYLTDGSGDLYQILHGQKSNVLSVVIPGDTVHIRLVTDANTALTGYHVDRVDVMGDAMGGSGGAGTGGMGSSVGGAGGSMGGTGGSLGGAGGASGGAGGASGGAGGSTGSGGNGATGGTGGIGGTTGTGGLASTGGSGGDTAGSGGAGGVTATDTEGGGGASTTTDTAGGGGGGSGDAKDQGGCGCRTAPDPSTGTVPVSLSFGVAFAAAFSARRRRRRHP